MSDMTSRLSNQGIKIASTNIRPAQKADEPDIAAILIPVFRDGTSYAVDRNITSVAALRYWLSEGSKVFVAEAEGLIVGTYYLRANHGGGGSHVCNCGYITADHAAGQGVARAMCEHSLETARLHGFKAMQFNFVVSTNERAVKLWASLGFSIVGRVPEAFDHPVTGLVDALIMHRTM